MTEPASWPPDPTPGRRPASSWIILLLAVAITVVTVIGLLINYLGSNDPDPTPTQVIPTTTGDGIVQIRWATDPVNTDTVPPVAVVLTALQEYWAGVDDLGAAVPGTLGPVTAIDPGAAAFADGAPGCLATPAQVAGNAYFCPQDFGMLFDNTALVPLLLDHYGEPGLIASLAHEYGHYVQAIVGPTSADRLADPQTYPALLVELQADCYAGVFLQHTMSSASTRLQLTPADLPAALAPLVEFHDPADLDPADPTAHGAAVDRLRATIWGHRGDARTCFDLTLADFAPALGGTADPASTTPRLSEPAAVRDETDRSVQAFASAHGLPAPALPAAPVDSAFGQFAAATVLVLDGWGTDSASCLTGAWVADTTTRTAPGTLGSWLSDPDEAVLAVVEHARSTAGVDLEEFVRGYESGASACSGD